MQINDLRPAQVAGIKRIYSNFGTGADGVRRVSQTFHITESAAKAFATALTEKPKAPAKAVTESAAPAPTADAISDAYGARKAALATRLVNEVQAAEAKPLSSCSLQELQSLTAAAATEAGMFG
jgi:hypothetical protein